MKKRNGFTLPEVLTVIAIIGILSAIAIPLYRNYLEKGYEKEAQSVLEQFTVLVPEYQAQHAILCPDCDTTGTYTYATESSITSAFPKFIYKRSQYIYSITFDITCTAGQCGGSATCTANPREDGAMAGKSDITFDINSL